MNDRILLLAILLLVLNGCNDAVENENNNSFTIEAGTICGWCTLNDTLEIYGNSFRYVDYANCQNTEPTTHTTGKLSSAEIDNLLRKLDVNEFFLIDINSCNVCADGCDDWISYTKDGVSHLIRFSRGDKQLGKIQDFVDELFFIKSSYSGK